MLCFATDCAPFRRSCIAKLPTAATKLSVLRCRSGCRDYTWIASAYRPDGI